MDKERAVLVESSVVDAVQAVLDERSYQDAKWGTIQENPHTMAGWLLLIQAELDEAKIGLIKGGTGRDSVTAEIVQVAALALAALEQHGVSDKTGRIL